MERVTAFDYLIIVMIKVFSFKSTVSVSDFESTIDWIITIILVIICAVSLIYSIKKFN